MCSNYERLMLEHLDHAIALLTADRDRLQRELSEARADLAYAASTGDECALEVAELRRRVAGNPVRYFECPACGRQWRSMENAAACCNEV